MICGRTHIGLYTDTGKRQHRFMPAFPLSSSGKPSNDVFPGDLITRRGGRISANEDAAAFIHVAPRMMPLPVLVSVPHAGRSYPENVLANMRDPQLSQLRLEDRHVDALGVEIARATGTGLLVSHAPRAMVDLNRAEDDVDWEMIAPSREDEPRARRTAAGPVGTNARARSGLGLVPRRLPGFGEIWRQRLDREELDRRIREVHQSYHEFLGQELARIRDEWGAALLIDLHSMPPLRPTDGETAAPRIVLGDRFGASCHNALISRAFGYLDREGCAAAHNRPYSGGYVLDRHADPRNAIHAVQIEVCRSAYLDIGLSKPSAALGPLAKMLAGLVRELGAQTAGLGNRGDMPQAAE